MSRQETRPYLPIHSPCPTVTCWEPHFYSTKSFAGIRGEKATVQLADVEEGIERTAGHATHAPDTDWLKCWHVGCPAWISQIGKSQQNFCHRPSGRNGIVSYRNGAFFFFFLKFTAHGGVPCKKSPARPPDDAADQLGTWAVFANPANPWCPGNSLLQLGILASSTLKTKMSIPICLDVTSVYWAGFLYIFAEPARPGMSSPCTSDDAEGDRKMSCPHLRSVWPWTSIEELFRFFSSKILF